LIDPGANQANLVRCQRLGRRAEPRRVAGTARATTTGRRRSTTGRRAARTAGTTWAGSELGRHGHVIVDSRHSRDHQALLAVVRDDDFAILATLQHGFQAVEAQVPLVFLSAVAAKAGGLEDRANILLVGDTLRARSGRNLADIDFGDIPFIVCL
jgi:hypothetical protein